MSGTVLVLGPQRPSPNVAAALDAHGAGDRVAVVTAGWRHDESDIGSLERDLGREVLHLPLYGWFEQVAADAPELARAYRARQERIRSFKRLIRPRVSAAYRAVLKVKDQRSDTPDLRAAELSDAIGALRALDERIIDGCESIRAEFPELVEPWSHDALRARHAEVLATLEDAGCVAIAGGHVAILLNRMEFFGLRGALQQLVERGGLVAAWSAGAMTLTERVVLYYDDPPEGPSEPEVLDRGLGLLRDRILMPHARTRLRWDVPERIALLNARFGRCIGLENGAAIRVVDGVWRDVGDSESLTLVGEGEQLL